MALADQSMSISTSPTMERFLVIVKDGGRGRVAVREGVNPAEGGMGLKLVDAFADRWGVEDGTTNVWFELAARRFGRQAL